MKPKLILSAFALFAVLLSACGPSGTATPTARPTEAATAEVTSEATVEATSEATSEATMEATSEATSDATAEATAEGTSEASGSSELFGSAWLLTSMNGTTVSADTPISLTFDETELSGVACNSFSGSYTTNGDEIEISQVVSTLKACVEPAGLTELETTFFDTLGKVTTYERTDDTLTLGTEDDADALVFKPDVRAAS